MALQCPEEVSTRKELKEWILESFGEKYEVIENKSTDFGKTLWVAVRPVIKNPRVQGDQSCVVCFRMEKNDDGKWGYIRYEEGLAPYTDCPESILDCVQPTTNKGAKKWRERVRAS